MNSVMVRIQAQEITFPCIYSMGRSPQQPISQEDYLQDDAMSGVFAMSKCQCAKAADVMDDVQTTCWQILAGHIDWFHAYVYDLFIQKRQCFHASKSDHLERMLRFRRLVRVKITECFEIP